ncbi:MAG: peptidoglycan DD-metalloendopeptidase family protein [Proteobacteria bacterium]|nr:peptidoglycan DD-metalloendopeptidase family protein [Pseudomonadota bacterium]
MLDLHLHYKRLGTALALVMVLFGSTRAFKHYYSVEQIPSELAANPTTPVAPIIEETTLTLASGGSVQKLLTGFGVNKESALQIANAFAQFVPHNKLKSGQDFNVRYKRSEQGVEIESFHSQSSIDQKIIITKADGNYISKAEKIHLTPVVHVFEGNVHSSFYSAAMKAGVPTKLVQEAVDVLSYVVNFQHGIQPGASFKILCNALRNDKGDIVKIEQLRFVSLKTGQQDHKLFAFTENGKVRFFNEKGESVVRSLLQTPLNATKLCVTSGFGMRRHPIHGYNAKHKGVDFGAPSGTPVLAAGDGRVLACGWSGGYGNRVHIRHSSGYETVYAHLKFINKNIKPGAAVSQRQVLGGVGMTGSATGPHLHFEVILNKHHINPMKVQALPSLKLTGGSLKKFETVKSATQKEMVDFIQTKAVA